MYIFVTRFVPNPDNPLENGHGFRPDKVRFRPNVKDRINATV